MWLFLYDIYFLFYSIVVLYFSIIKKNRKEGIQNKKEVFIPVISMFFPILLNFAGEFKETDFNWISILLIIIGLFLSTWGIFTLRKSFSIFIEAINLVKTGPYKFLKHPIYLGEILITFGFVLLINTILGYLIFIGCVIIISVRTRMEEKKLTRVFPDESEYFNSTPAFTPFLRRRKKTK